MFTLLNQQIGLSMKKRLSRLAIYHGLQVENLLKRLFFRTMLQIKTPVNIWLYNQLPADLARFMKVYF